ncbi:hypothetical protein F4677DRAFT_446746 [Hypoxylon crocopeplum]|nr:hypothetical protein F4677DRAFT_446746 [Hypoxylon crocopeplum]
MSSLADSNAAIVVAEIVAVLVEQTVADVVEESTIPLPDRIKVYVMEKDLANLPRYQLHVTDSGTFVKTKRTIVNEDGQVKIKIRKQKRVTRAERHEAVRRALAKDRKPISPRELEKTIADRAAKAQGRTSPTELLLQSRSRKRKARNTPQEPQLRPLPAVFSKVSEPGKEDHSTTLQSSSVNGPRPHVPIHKEATIAPWKGADLKRG